MKTILRIIKDNKVISLVIGLLFMLLVSMKYYGLRIDVKGIAHEFTNDNTEACVVKATGNVLVAVDTYDQYESLPLKINRGYKQHLLPILYNIVKPDEVVVEVDSGIGYHTAYLSEVVGDKGRVYSFEQSDRARQLLVYTLRLNNADHNVSVNDYVLYNSIREVLIDTLTGALNRYKIHLNNDEVRDKGHMEAATSYTLDGILYDVPVLSLLKINNMYNAIDVIRGATKLIERSPNIDIMFEWSPELLYKSEPTQKIMHSFFTLGFEVWLLNPDGTKKLLTEDMLENVAGDLVISRKGI
jgi:hypothetical protein